jgi:hypothetical protein
MACFGILDLWIVLTEFVCVIYLVLAAYTPFLFLLNINNHHFS